MKKDEIRFIVMYTISDENTRSKFLEGLKSEFNLNEDDMLNESSYAISSSSVSDVIDSLYKILHNLNATQFDKDDFVDLYCTGSMDNKYLKKDFMIRKNIYPKIFNEREKSQDGIWSCMYHKF